jgi:exopolyphosphatase/guanosine-5'-triphosphate,3'-diphosphate pyrophosphatase
MPRKAVIDVGTNSVKVLVADVVDGSVLPVWETSEQTRLGQGFYETRQLQAGPINASAAVVARFALQASALGAATPRVIATSAARDASNAGDLIQAIHAASGLTTEVISGETEAEWGFTGVTTDPSCVNRTLLVLDVGGGSTEFILGRRDPEGLQLAYRQSCPIGSVRLQEQFPPSDPPGPRELSRVREWLEEFLKHNIQPALAEAFTRFGHPERVLGIGGTTAILAMMEERRSGFDREIVERARFQGEALGRCVENLWSQDLATRQKLPGLPPERADVILFGAAIYDRILRVFDLPELGVSTRGLRYAALLD